MAIRDEKVQLLKSVDIFSETPETVLTKISLALIKLALPPNRTVIQKGEMGDCMYIIYRGRVKIHEEEHVIAEMETGKIFGELSLLDPEPRSASVTTLEETILYRLDQAIFYEIIARRPEVAQGIMRLLVHRLRGQNSTIIAGLKQREKELTLLVEARTAELRQAYDVLQGKQVEIENAYEELRAINEELQATNDHLISANREILRQKDEIEKQRDQILRQQEQVIQSANLAAVGLIAPTVAHEINTPLGAIRGALYNLRTLLPESFQRIPQIVQALDSEKRSLFWAFLGRMAHAPVLIGAEREEAAVLREKLRAVGLFSEIEAEEIASLWWFLQRSGVTTPVLSAREERRIIRVLTDELIAAGLERAEDMAEQLVGAGLYENITYFFPLFSEEDAFEIALRIGKMWKQMLTIQNAADKAIKIVVALKDYVSKEVAPINVADNIEIVLTLYEYYLNQGVEVEKDFAHEDAKIRASPHELAQVWTNLILNAVKAMNGKGKIIVRSNPARDGYIVVTVQDFGPGIEAEKIPNLFIHNYDSARPRTETSGVGLPVCRAVVEKYKGRIYAESKPGDTTFTVELPVWG